MTNSERRYEPTIDLQGFDLTMNVDAVHEPSRLPLVVVIALVVLAAFGGVVWLAYTQGVERGRESVSRELIAQQFWKISKPAAPAYTGLKIYEPPGASEQAANAKPSSPVKQQAATAIPPLRPTASAAPDTSAPAAPIGAKPTLSPVTSDQVARPASSRSDKALSGETPAVSRKTLAAGEPPIKAPAVSTETPQRVATRAPTELTKPATAPPATTHPLTEPDSLAPAPSSAPPAARAPAPAAKAPAPPARKQVTAVSPAPASASVTAPAPASTHAATSGILLQIGSYKSDAEARASWQGFKSQHDAAAPYQPDVKQVELGARGTWYRLRIGPFPDKQSALETCRKLKADGASCLLAQ